MASLQALLAEYRQAFDTHEKLDEDDPRFEAAEHAMVCIGDLISDTPARTLADLKLKLAAHELIDPPKPSDGGMLASLLDDLRST